MSRESRAVARIHVGLVLAELICVTAFVIEIRRAVGGNTLSWAYVFEWPILAAYAVYMWRQLVRQERGDSRVQVAPATTEETASLQEWNEYLARVHEQKPPHRDG